MNGEDEFYFMQVQFEVMVEYLSVMSSNYLKRIWESTVLLRTEIMKYTGEKRGLKIKS